MSDQHSLPVDRERLELQMRARCDRFPRLGGQARLQVGLIVHSDDLELSVGLIDPQDHRAAIGMLANAQRVSGILGTPPDALRLSRGSATG